MYNLTVEGAHTFFVGQDRWLVHNAGSCARSRPPWMHTDIPGQKFFYGKDGIEEAYKHLAGEHGVPIEESSRLLHKFKQGRMGAADDAVISPTDDVYDPRNGEWLGNIPSEAKKARR